MIRIGGILVIIVGVLMLHHQFAPGRMLRRSERWPSTEGVITTFRTQCWHSLRTGSACGVHLRYRYQVAGRDLENERITFIDDNLDTSDDFRTYRARYPVGQTVRVFYDPTDPTSAVLERTAEWSLRDLFVAAGVLLVGALMLLPRTWFYRLGGAPPEQAEIFAARGDE